MKLAYALGRGRSNCGDLHAADLPCVVVKLEKHFEKRVDAVRARKNNPVVGVRVLYEFAEFAQISRRFDADGRQFDHICAERAELAAQSPGLLACPGNDNPFSE